MRDIIARLRRAFRTEAARAAFDDWAVRADIANLSGEDGDGNPLAPRVEDGRLVLRLYRPIGPSWWGCVDAELLDDALRGHDDLPADIFCDSPGGDVLTMRSMNRRIRDRSGETVFHVDGLAASAATILACACDRRVAARGTRLLIHEAWTLAIGNKRALRAEAEDLEKIDREIAEDYAAIGSRSAEEFAALMQEENLMTPEEAMECGLVDAVEGQAKAKAKAQGNGQLRLRAAHAAHLATISTES